MQQSSSLHLILGRLRKIVACSQPYLAVLFGKVSTLHKMRPLYVKIMICRPFSLAVGRLKKKNKKKKKKKKEKMDKIVVWPISVYNSSDVF